MQTLEPLDELTDDLIKWLREKGSKVTTVTEVITQKERLIYDEIEAGVKRANAKAVSRASVVQKFTILPKDFSIVTEELGPTLKLKRQVVTKKYEDTIETMYQSETQEKKYYSL